MPPRFPRVNPTSGLHETWNQHFGVPSVRQKAIGAIRFNGGSTAVHSVPLAGGLTLDFYARLNKSDELVLTFHGAYRKDAYLYPRFERVRSLADVFPSHIAVADPTMMLDPTRTMLLSWYLGGPGWDPSGDLLKVIERAKGRTGAKHVLCIGGSGGGFAALRLSSMIPGSLAYVQNPATAIRRSFATARSRYFGTVWSGWDEGLLQDAFPERFDMPRLYRALPARNFVYYAQSSRDPHYLAHHFEPFRMATGVEPTEEAPMGRRWLKLYEGVNEGHGTMTAVEFTTHLDDALTWWRARR